MGLLFAAAAAPKIIFDMGANSRLYTCKTLFTSSNELVRQIWEEKLFDDIQLESYFSRFAVGDGVPPPAGFLKPSRGDPITFGIVQRFE
jgi:hypothetical protein